MEEIVTVKIGPSLKEITLDGGVLTAPFDGFKLTYELPRNLVFDTKNADEIKKAFWNACVICSKPWQIADSLNNYFGLIGLVKITETPKIGKQEVCFG